MFEKGRKKGGYEYEESHDRLETKKGVKEILDWLGLKRIDQRTFYRFGVLEVTIRGYLQNMRM